MAGGVYIGGSIYVFNYLLPMDVSISYIFIS